LRVNANGTTTRVANLSEFQREHPVASPEEDDFWPGSALPAAIGSRTGTPGASMSRTDTESA
jgi:hypothetical protein